MKRQASMAAQDVEVKPPRQALQTLARCRKGALQREQASLLSVSQELVAFSVQDKIDVNGARAHPLYRFLKGKQPGSLPGGIIEWNYVKFLVARDGTPLRRYGSRTDPLEFEGDVSTALIPAVI